MPWQPVAMTLTPELPVNLPRLELVSDLTPVKASSDLRELREAKRFSDAREWDGKYAILSRLMKKDPRAWRIDQDDGFTPYVGVRHRTGWRYHLPRNLVQSLLDG